MAEPNGPRALARAVPGTREVLLSWVSTATVPPPIPKRTLMKHPEPPRSARPSPAVQAQQSAGTRGKTSQRRESIESFVVVFVAFLVWSFEAEGFVIPTGSMAPTLDGPAQGDHLSRVRPRLLGELGLRGRLEWLGGQHGHPRGLGDVRELPPRDPRGRCAQRLRRPHLHDEERPGAALPSRRPARSGRADGRWPSSSSPRSPRSATSSAWSACPRRPSASRREISGGGRIGG